MKEKGLCEICNPKQWKTISSDMLTENGYPVYGANGVIGYYTNYNHEEPTILVTCRGATCGALNICEAFSYVNGNAMALDDLSEEIDIKYLYYYLSHRGLSDSITGSAQPQITRQSLAPIRVIYPPLDEQGRIAVVLDKVSNLMARRRQQLDKLDELVKSRFIELFGDPVDNPKGWTMVPLNTRCEIITGNTPSRAEVKNYGEFIEWIKSDNINTPHTFLTEAQEYLSEIGFQKCRFVEADSLLMTCIAGSVNCIGNVAVADRRVAFNQQINAIVPNEDEVLYLYWLMLLSKPAIHRTINMSLKGILSKRQLSEMMFPFPPVVLQKQFVTFVEQTDKSKQAIQKSLDKLETLKMALMQKYFE